MNSNFKDRLKEALDRSGMSQSELSRRAHIGRNSISDYLKGKYEAKQDKIYSLAKALNVSEAWLMGYDVDDHVKDILPIYNQLDASRQHKVYTYAQTQLNEQNNINDENTTYITTGRSTAAGLPIDGDSEDALQQQLVVSRDEIPRGADEVITIAGDSMEPDLPKGSKQFVHHQPVPDYDGQIVVVTIRDEGVTCKKLYRENGKIKLVSINEKYDPMIYPADEIKVIGKVIKNSR
ncbi:LexA family transcriptional regulator [Ligilactobacillus sp. 110_WCHN]|uniref:LexA family transcriptional regulator n=1 Tax=Ligilactobacillus sp. 110_WCHN TaxID=3057125 RepID=UPI00267388E2|nr:LexA family transcriptional regulator [Ligilactobacillus sp. 110_WCHN]MDO3393923.1 LexA family transcriptional regulator [Ligilactobacillus sp. 110_WCHN]